jgi:lipopolysaccharide transport system ATP-binding protein
VAPHSLNWKIPVNAIEFEHVSKTYAIYERPGDRLRELLTLGRRSFHRDFRALSDLSFSIARGEVFCIVGENGSGKSTTLQLIAGILEPSQGSVRVNGRVSALLELGSGFNPEFTGRDNVYLNGAILGLSKRELDRRYNAIEDFAEIGDFIRQPVKTYSSGMVMRLAFAVAINVDPEILLVDEALAVGDVYFRHRCMRKVHELRNRGITIVFVSHSAADVKAIGDRAMWLERGRMMAIGDTDRVVDDYLALAIDKEERHVHPVSTSGAPAIAPERVDTIPNIDQRHGDGRAEVLGIAVINEYGDAVHLIMPDSRIVVRMTFRSRARLVRPVAGFVLRNHLGLEFAETSTDREGSELDPLIEGEVRTVDFHLNIPQLYPGAFSFSPWVADGALAHDNVCDWIDNAITVQMGRGEGPVYGYIHVPCRIEMNPSPGAGPQPVEALAGTGESRIA